MRNNMGQVFLRDGRPDDARREFEKALELDPKNSDALLNLATINGNQGRVPEAIKLLEEAAKISPNHEQVNECLGLAYLRADRAENAYRSLLMVNRLYPKNWVAPIALAALHAASNHPQEARRWLDLGLKLGGKDARTFAAGYAVLHPLLEPGGKSR